MSSDIDVLKLELQPFVKRSVTTGPGNVGGTTLVDASLVEAANFWNDCWVLLRTGTYAGALRRVTGFAPGTVTLDHTVGGQIVPGIQYVMSPIMPTQDTGLNTNPRRYEVDNGFRSQVIARAGGVATALWTTGMAGTPKRTAGKITVIYHIEYYNPTAASVTAWLEIGGVVITVPMPIGAGDSEVVDYPAGLKVGNNDVNLNASANTVQAMISGLEV